MPVLPVAFTPKPIVEPVIICPAQSSLTLSDIKLKQVPAVVMFTLNVTLVVISPQSGETVNGSTSNNE